MVSDLEVKPPPPKRRLWPWLAMVVAVVGVAAAAWLLLPTLLLAAIEREASARGIELKECQLDFKLTRVELRQCQFRSVETNDISGGAKLIIVELDGLNPKSALIQGARVDAHGTVELEHLLRLGDPPATSFVVTLEASTLRWFMAEGTEPTITLSDMEFDTHTRALKSNLVLGTLLTGVLTARDGQAIAELRLNAAPSARVRVSAQNEPDAVVIRAEYDELPIAMPLALGLARVPTSLSEVTTNGKLYLEVPTGLTTKRPAGDVNGTAKNIALPVPVELQGLVFGNTVAYSASFVLDRRKSELHLKRVKLEAGVLALKGDASASLEGFGVRLKGKLRGRLSCAAIAKSAAKAHASPELSRLAGRIAKRALSGSVGIVVAMDAHSAKLDEAVVVKTIVPGCGLKAQPIADLAKIPGELLNQLPSLPELEEQLKRNKLKPPKVELKLPGLPFPKRLKEEQDAPPKEGASPSHGGEGPR